MKVRTYRDLRRLGSFEDRFKYLSLGGHVGEATFGFDRWINQQFYRSREWKDIRHYVIVRDNGCDLGADGHEISGRVLIHHMNPLTQRQISHSEDNLLNPEYLISTSHQTHNAIHYGDESLLPRPFVERRPGDTNLWRH